MIATEESEGEATCWWQRQHHHPWQLCCWQHSLQKVAVARGILSDDGGLRSLLTDAGVEWAGYASRGCWVRLSSVRLLSNATVCHGYNTL